MDQPAQAGADAPAEQATPYPAPPEYYHLYEAGPDAGPVPPRPVTDSIIHVFGEPFDMNDPYERILDTGRLYNVEPDGSVKFKQELQVLNKGLLFMFLELLNTLVEQPSAYAAALTPIKETLFNMNFLLNMARPVQARETLKATLKLQIEEKKAALAGLKEQAAKIQQQVLAVTEQLAAVGGDVAESAPRPAAQQQDQQQQAAAMEEG